MRTTVVGSWPPEARYAAELTRYYRGELDNGSAEKLVTDVASAAIAQQRVCGVDEITGGETSADSFILHFPHLLSGIAPSENTAAWDGRGTFQITGPIGAPDGLGIAAAFERERSIYQDLPKVTIPGPSEITTMLETREAARGVWPLVIELIRTEIRALIEIGAREIQLDVPRSQWDSPMVDGTLRKPSRPSPRSSMEHRARGEACTSAMAISAPERGRAIAHFDHFSLRCSV